MNSHTSIIKLAVVWLLAVGWSNWGMPTVVAQTESKIVALSVGEARIVPISFPVKGYRVVKQEVVRVSLTSEQKLSVEGLTEGNTDLQVTGEGGGTEMFRVTVTSSLEALRKEIQKDLDDIPGVEAEIGLGKVVLRGTITKPEQWQHLKKVLLPSYGDRVECKVKFRLQDESLLKLKTDLTKAGFKVLETTNKPDALGALTIESSGNLVFISGSVSSRGELERINSILSTYPWLKIKRDDTKNADDHCCAVINVATTPMLLEVDVAFVAVTDTESQVLGMNLLQNGLPIIGNVGAGRGPVSYQIGASMSATLQALNTSMPGRAKSVGHLTFRNDATDWKSFKDGGTIMIPISGALGATGVQPLEYGLILKAKGGLADAENVALDVEVELSVPIVTGNSANGNVIYDLKQSRSSSAVLCPVGKTVILAGTKQLTEGLNISGTPILGSIPLLNFLFSQRQQSHTDRRLLILFSPQISRAPTSAPPAVEQTIGTMEDANKPVTNLRTRKQTQ